jgi:S1-C subfamily serine protease
MFCRKALLAFLLLIVFGPLATAQPIGTIYRKVNASVVVIQTRQKDVSPLVQNELVDVGGLGSGVLISKDGKVLTAAHVVQVAEEIAVQFAGGDVVKARVVGSRPSMDIALLQLEDVPPGAEVASLGDSDTVQVGDRVFVVGAPFGISHTLTVGYISARREPGEDESGIWGAEFFQTDAAVNPGNSGGPMFNLAGEVVGIVSHIISPTGGFTGLGFAVTSNTARQMLLNRRPFWSGVEGYFVAEDTAAVLNLPTAGVLVQRVAKGSPAEKLGLRPGTVKATIGDQSLLLGGDVVIEVLGISLAEESSFEKMWDRLERMQAGEALTVKVLRGGKAEELTIALPGH